jgi:hypothetical protein
MWRRIFFSGAAMFAFATASSASAAIISNFESGTDEGWTKHDVNDATIAMAVVPGGSGGSGFALQVTRTGGSWNNTMKLALPDAQWADVGTGTTLTMDIKAQGGTDVPGWWLQSIPIFNSQLGGWDQLSSTDVVLDGQWRTYTWTYPAQPPDGGTYRELFLASQGGANPGMTFLLDNIGIVPIPEPGSIAMLALAAAPLLGRRRRMR